MAYSMWLDSELTDAGGVVADLALEVGCASAARGLDMPYSTVGRVALQAYGKMKEHPQFMANVPHNKIFQAMIPATDERIAKPIRIALGFLEECKDDWFDSGIDQGPVVKGDSFKEPMSLDGDDYAGLNESEPFDPQEYVEALDRKTALASLDAPDGGGLVDVQQAIRQAQDAMVVLDGLREDLQVQLKNLLWLEWFFQSKAEKEGVQKQVNALLGVVAALRAENQALADHLAGREQNV